MGHVRGRREIESPKCNAFFHNLDLNRAMRNETAIGHYQIDFEADFAGLPEKELESMAEAGQEVLEIHRALAKTGDNLVGELIRGHETFYEWDHYPPGDVYDSETHSQFYYHAHPMDERFDNEHGHFHTFLRPKGMPPGIKPAQVPDFQKPEDPDDELSHLVSIAMDSAGFPFRLFTVNRWVTGEVWYRADDVCTLLDYFNIDHTQPSWPVNRWVSGMLQLFRPQIKELLTVRDQTIAAWSERYPDKDVYEDRDLEVTSFLDISVEAQVREIARSLMDRP